MPFLALKFTFFYLAKNHVPTPFNYTKLRQELLGAVDKEPSTTQNSLATEPKEDLKYLKINNSSIVKRFECFSLKQRNKQTSF